MSDTDPLDDAHLLLFARITREFARHEALMQRLMARLAECRLTAVMILTRELDFIGRREALLDLLRHTRLPRDQFDRINKLLVTPTLFAPLAHDIAHCLWVSGPTGDRIQPDWILQPPPCVMALHHDPAAIGEDFVALDPDRTTYSLDQLAEITATLAANRDSLAAYLDEISLLPAD